VQSSCTFVGPLFNFNRVNDIIQYYGTEITESLSALQLVDSQVVS
jgi:hypothetical protein